MSTPASVDEYMAALPGEQRAVLEEVRATIRAAAPEATETIAYGMPAFRDHGRFLVSFAAYRNHLSLYPASGRVMAELGDELRPYFSGKGTLRFGIADPLPASLVERIVRIRLAETAQAQGDPQD